MVGVVAIDIVLEVVVIVVEMVVLVVLEVVVVLGGVEIETVVVLVVVAVVLVVVLVLAVVVLSHFVRLLLSLYPDEHVDTKHSPLLSYFTASETPQPVAKGITIYSACFGFLSPCIHSLPHSIWSSLGLYPGAHFDTRQTPLLLYSIAWKTSHPVRGSATNVCVFWWITMKLPTHLHIPFGCCSSCIPMHTSTPNTTRWGRT